LKTFHVAIFNGICWPLGALMHTDGNCNRHGHPGASNQDLGWAKGNGKLGNWETGEPGTIYVRARTSLTNSRSCHYH